MYAIVETGGKQYRVKTGDTIAVERLSGEPGDTFDLGRVLLIAGNGDGETRVGTPGVAGAIVRAEVVEQGRGEKIVVFRYKSKVRYRRKTGHRQSLTRVRITDILLDGQSATRAAVAEPAAEPPSAAEPTTPAATAEGAASPAAAEAATPVAVAEARPSAEPATPVAAAEPPSAAEPTTTVAVAEARPSAEAARPATAVAAEESAMPASAGEGGPSPESEESPEA
jgi:large subunit ribosomal protein L21